MAFENWDQFCMDIAKLARRACWEDYKDKREKEGAVITKNNRILGVGWNGLPRNCEKRQFVSPEEYIISAVENVIIFSNLGSEDLKDATIYTTKYPTLRSVVLLKQNNIRQVVVDTKDRIPYEIQKFLDHCISCDYNKFTLSFETLITPKVSASEMSLAWPKKYYEYLPDIVKKYSGQGAVVVKDGRILEVGWCDSSNNAITHALKFSIRNKAEFKDTIIYITENPTSEDEELISEYQMKLISQYKIKKLNY